MLLIINLKGNILEALAILIPLSLVLVGIAVWVFFRMVDSGQFEDLERVSRDIIDDIDLPIISPTQQTNIPQNATKTPSSE